MQLARLGPMSGVSDPFADTNDALRDLRSGLIRGAKVLSFDR